MRLFGTSGIRRVVNTEFLELVLKIGLATGKVYDSVVVASDTRTSSSAMKHAFISGLLAAGSRCSDAGTVPTPTLALATRGFQAGVMITASHNPPQYNGIKLVNQDGSAFDAGQRAQIEDMVLHNSLSAAPWQKIKRSIIYEGAIEKHINHILPDFPDIPKLKVVLDCGCGAASVISPTLLRRLGCEVVVLNCCPSGFFPHEIEPVEANLGDLKRATTELGADLGIAHDGDADRMMAVDDKGRFMAGDKLLAIFARQMAAKEIVTTIDASMSIEEMDFRITRTPVGDIYVSEELRNGGDFGGEPSGSWVFPQSSLCPDGIYAAACLVAIASRQKLSQLVDSIPHYPIIRGSIAGEVLGVPRLKEELLTLEPLSLIDVDGIKLVFTDGWLLVRPSGTEPKIRITAEAKTEARVHQIYDKGATIIMKYIKNMEK